MITPRKTISNNNKPPSRIRCPFVSNAPYYFPKFIFRNSNNGTPLRLILNSKIYSFREKRHFFLHFDFPLKTFWNSRLGSRIEFILPWTRKFKIKSNNAIIKNKRNCYYSKLHNWTFVVYQKNVCYHLDKIFPKINYFTRKWRAPLRVKDFDNWIQIVLGGNVFCCPFDFGSEIFEFYRRTIILCKKAKEQNISNVHITGVHCQS